MCEPLTTQQLAHRPFARPVETFKTALVSDLIGAGSSVSASSS